MGHHHAQQVQQPIYLADLSPIRDKEESRFTEEELDPETIDQSDYSVSPGPLKSIQLKDQESQIISTLEAFIVDDNFKKILFVCWCGGFLCLLDGTIVSTTMSNIASDFNQSDLVTWIPTSYLLTSTAFQPLYGKTSDILGRKALLIFAQVFFTLGILLSTFATSVQTLSIARGIAGIGGAGLMTLVSIIISDRVPLSHRSMYTGYGSVIYSCAQIMGGPVGGLCIQTIGWRMMFLLQVPFMLVCIFLTLRVDIKVDHISDDIDTILSRDNLKRIDIGGIITLNLAISSLIFLLSSNENSSRGYKYGLSILLIVSTIAYIIIEKYVAFEKIFEPELLKGELGLVGLVSGICSLSLYMILFISPLYLQIVQNISVTDVGYYTMFFVASNAAGSLISGMVIRRHDKSETDSLVSSIRTTLGAFILQSIGLFLLYIQLSYTSPNNPGAIWRLLFILELIISGMGVGAIGVGLVVFIVGKVGRERQASANTVVSLLKSLGNVLGVSISLSTYSKTIGSSIHDYFKTDDNKQYIVKLIKDSSFIWDGLPTEYMSDVLSIYKTGLTHAFYPALTLTIVALASMFLLNRSVEKLLD